VNWKGHELFHGKARVSFYSFPVSDEYACLNRYFEAFIEGQIAQRKYENATEVIEDGLRLLEARQAKREQLSRALQKGLDSGQAVGFDVNEWLESKRTGPEREEAA
jgi:putative addiction module CopG family antidote